MFVNCVTLHKVQFKVVRKVQVGDRRLSLRPEILEMTVSDVLARCPLLWEMRIELLDFHVTIITDILERCDISRLVKFMIRSGNLKSPGKTND